MQTTISSPLGNLILLANNNKITELKLFSKKSKPNSNMINTLFTDTKKQLENYFQNPKYKFNLPLNITGTPFQKIVWQALTKIPCGTTKTYGELAKELNTSARAIGNACRKNPLPIIIPCHRIVAKNGIGGFAGKTQGKNIAIKKWLLAHEGAIAC